MTDANILDDSTDTDSQLAPEKSIEEVYADRNALAVGYAALAWSLGMDVGWYEHDEWAVIYVETPEGQVSWHVRPETIPDWVPEADEDALVGHSRREKNRRIATVADQIGRLAAEVHARLDDYPHLDADEWTLADLQEEAEKAGEAAGLDVPLEGEP
jgi:hypothetical protein